MGYAAADWGEETALLVRGAEGSLYGVDASGDGRREASGAAEPGVNPAGNAAGASAGEPGVASAGDSTGEPAGSPDPDVLHEMGDEIVTLAAHLHAGTHRILELLAGFDRFRGWELEGHRSCAHWLAFRTGYDLGTAREHVRVARALEDLPRTGASMARGRLSFSQVRALTRVAKAENEADLLELAEGSTTAQLERMVRAWKKGNRMDEAAWERERHLSRKFSVFPDDDGMYVVRGRLDPEVGALLMRAVEAASDALHRDRLQEAVREQAPELAAELARGPAAEREAARRRADALGLLAERALAAGFGGEPTDVAAKSASGPPAENDTPPKNGDGSRTSAANWSENRTSAANGDCGCAASEVPVSGTRAERYQVMLHVDAETLSADGEPGRSELEDGTRVSAETSRRIACDAGLVKIARGADGSVLDVGRRRRTIPPALRRALEVRDRGCRFPGCGLRFTDAHHLVHWANGGKTNIDNTLLLCRVHHRLVHEGGWKVEWLMKDRPLFTGPRGQGHVNGRPPATRLPEDPVAALVRDNRARGAEPDARTAGARWKWERDIPDEVYLRATGAF